jgi:hypothetical protein
MSAIHIQLSSRPELDSDQARLLAAVTFLHSNRAKYNLTLSERPSQIAIDYLAARRDWSLKDVMRVLPGLSETFPESLKLSDQTEPRTVTFTPGHIVSHPHDVHILARTAAVIRDLNGEGPPRAVSLDDCIDRIVQSAKPGQNLGDPPYVLHRIDALVRMGYLAIAPAPEALP